MVPLKLAIIPLFIQLRDLDLLDTRLGLIIIYIAMGLPSAVFILSGFLRTLPGRIGGRGADRRRRRRTHHVVASCSRSTRPAMVIAGHPQRRADLERLLLPARASSRPMRARPFPQGLTAFMGEYTTNWGVLFAGLTLSALPITIVYILLSKQFIQGMTSGAVK